MKRSRLSKITNAITLHYRIASEEKLYQLMCFTAGQEIPKDSSKMMLEELALENTDPRESV